jgi:hypothetical protein
MTPERTRRPGVPRKRLVPLALVVVVGGLAAGCGADQPPTTTEWADGVCSAVSTWESSLESAVQPIASGDVSKDSLETAADDAKSATETLKSDLEDLGKPDTQVAQQAQDQIDTLTSQLQADVDAVKSAVEDASGITGITAAVTTATTTVATMKTQVNATITSLKQLDAKGELTTAFQQSSSCQQLTSGS